MTVTLEEKAALLQQSLDATDAALHQLHRALLVAGLWDFQRYSQAQMDLHDSRIDVRREVTAGQGS